MVCFYRAFLRLVVHVGHVAGGFQRRADAARPHAFEGLPFGGGQEEGQGFHGCSVLLVLVLVLGLGFTLFTPTCMIFFYHDKRLLVVNNHYIKRLS